MRSHRRPVSIGPPALTQTKVTCTYVTFHVLSHPLPSLPLTKDGPGTQGQLGVCVNVPSLPSPSATYVLPAHTMHGTCSSCLLHQCVSVPYIPASCNHGNIRQVMDPAELEPKEGFEDKTAYASFFHTNTGCR